MKIAIIGGTGNIGKGLAFRLKMAGYDVIIGSRKKEKALERAKECNEIVSKLGGEANIDGMENEKASNICDIAIITVPWEHAFSITETLKDVLKEKIVISPIVPMKFKDGFFIYSPPPEGSAGEKLARILDSDKIVVAFNTIPASRFAKVDERFNWDVPVCGDDAFAKEVVMDIINSIDGLRALNAGKLSNARIVESLTPMLINLAKLNNLKPLGIRYE